MSTSTTSTHYIYDLMRRRSTHNCSAPVGNSRAVRRLPAKPRSVSSYPAGSSPTAFPKPPAPRRLSPVRGSSVSAVLAALREQEYFHGILPREQINEVLQQNGDFIVRESKKDQGSAAIVLSVFWDGPRHFLLNRCTDGQWALSGLAFKNVTDLVDHYMKTKEELSKASGAKLLRPVKKEKWQLSNDDIVKDKVLGKGHFGEVWKGSIKRTFGSKEVAIKLVNPERKTTEEERKRVLAEAQIMMGFNHPNVVKFIGIAAERDPLMLVMELVEGGSLRHYLKEHKGNVPNGKKIGFCVDAAKGMEYLEQKQCIHRDLAARNCLLDSSGSVKISDFGMSIADVVHRVRGKKKVPVKWTAPEAIQFGIFTSKSDVWSFGVLMWEIFSEGGVPYTGKSNKEVIAFIKAGKRADPPEGTPPAVGKLMHDCWLSAHPSRPNFTQIKESLQSMK